MPRYLIERAWDELEDGGAAKGSPLEAHPV